MIARIWRGWASPENADAYEDHFRTSVQAELRGVEGFVEAQLLRRVVGDEVAVVAPHAQDVLSRFEKRVAHFEVAFVTPGAERSLP